MRGGSNEYPQCNFLSKNKNKKNVYPVNLSFTIQKRRLRGSIYTSFFVMELLETGAIQGLCLNHQEFFCLDSQRMTFKDEN